MSVGDALFLVIRWLHAISAVAWVGGGLFYLLVLRPSLRRSASAADPAIGQDFRALVMTAMGILLVTGVIMTFDRLTSGFVGVPYVAVLVVKVSMAMYMFYLVRFLRPGTYPEEPEGHAQGYRRWTGWISGATLVVILGVIVILLADVLSTLFENGLEG